MLFRAIISAVSIANFCTFTASADSTELICEGWEREGELPEEPTQLELFSILKKKPFSVFLGDSHIDITGHSQFEGRYDFSELRTEVVPNYSSSTTFSITHRTSNIVGEFRIYILPYKQNIRLELMNCSIESSTCDYLYHFKGECETKAVE